MPREYTWMLNIHNLEVEVLREDVVELTKRGYKTITQRTIKKPIQASIDFEHYNFGGYGRVIELLKRGIEFTPDSPNLVTFGFPRPVQADNRKHFLVTAWEADVLPSGWVQMCNQYDAVIVPSLFNQKLFKSSGVTVPVETMIQGTDNLDIIENVPEFPFVFLHYNSFSDYKRKGWDLVVEAFLNLFGRYEHVELILKSCEHDNLEDVASIPKRPNIRIVNKNMTRTELARLQEISHCFVFPSRGEGIGLPPIETIARGIPTIVSNHTGMADYAQFAIRLTKNFSKTAAYYPSLSFETKPYWINPSLRELEEKMFYVYRNYAKVKQQAIQNAKMLNQYFNLENTVSSFIRVIEQYGNS